ncbi:MAG: hypothetical protein HUU21_35690 [Polyangiaceae bacterium]|nr:hypothetical protein [Polyangiaceae bacterium]
MSKRRLTRPAAALTASLAQAAIPRFSRAICAVTAVSIALCPSAAEAQADEYKQRMDRGIKLYQDKNYVAAIVEFEAAYKVRPKASPLINISLCHKGMFNYPKAITALELALAKHSDTMDPGDIKAAKDAIAEMRDLLAYVTIKVDPPTATVTIDDQELPAGTLDSPVPLGPGPHRIAARAEGYASAEQTVSVASGEKDRKVSIALVPDKGYVTVRTDDPQMAIAIDQQPLGYGEWSGFLTPGSHLVQMYKPGGASFAVQIVVAAGTKQEIRPGSGGVAISPAGGPPLPPMPPGTMPGLPVPEKPKPLPPRRGWFAMATGSLLVPLNHPYVGESGEFDTTSGAAGGFRAGYRVNTPASFDFMFEYGDISTDFTVGGGSYSYNKQSFRLGINLRLMTPGKSARFVGNLGGGIAIDDIDFRTADGAPCPTCSFKGSWGVNPYLLNELGFELDFSGVLVGACLQSYFQSARGIEISGTESDAYDEDVLVHIGGSLRAGYALW